ncbi:MAG: CoA-binding protein [Bifidobacteriaceae bacterium]|nr:CoA-binding protein [Bifidobacteriaceae bacterium]
MNASARGPAGDGIVHGTCSIDGKARDAIGGWTPPGARERLAILRRARSVALVGASANPARASHFVATYLVSSTPYRIYFVNPRADQILGRPAYPSLAALPETPDIVDVFRRHDDLPEVLEQTLAVGAGVLWLQLGSWHRDVASAGAAAGIAVVMDRCLKIEHARFHGGLHLAGFDTGVITSKRPQAAPRAAQTAQPPAGYSG